MAGEPVVIDLGRMAYAEAYEEQCRHQREVLASRERGGGEGGEMGRVLLVEHDPPVITVSRRATAWANLIASPEQLRAAGVEVAETDRGGDITYHGPGQLVVYPILDLNRLNVRLHGYMRLLEQAVIDYAQGLGLDVARDPAATGVWVRQGAGTAEEGGALGGKLCAMGVRVRQWITMHGLALNVTTNLSHFGLIVPCGLVGRRVTSLERELGAAVPGMDRVKEGLSARLVGLVREAAERADAVRRMGGIER